MSEETSLHLLLGAQDQRLGAERDRLPCGPTGTSSGNFKKTKTRMVPIYQAYGHDLSKTILLGSLEGGRLRGRQRKCWINVKEWTALHMTELLTMAFRKKKKKKKTGKGSLLKNSLGPPTTQSVAGLN